MPQIFRAALQLVLKTGYAGLKMGAVAKEAGVATGTLYNYFENKQALINALFRELKRAKMDEVFKDHNPADKFEVNFKRLWCNYLKAGLKEPERNLFIEQYQRSEYLDAQSQAMNAAYYQPLYDFLTRAQKARLIQEVPVPVLAAQLMGAANGVARLYFGSAQQMSQQAIEQCYAMAWRSIQP